MYKYKVQSIKHCKTSPIYDVLDHKNHIFSESSWSKDIKTINQLSYPQIHKNKYTNTQLHNIWRSAKNPQHVVYFWKEDCSGESKIILTCVKRAKKSNKYTNTAYDEVPDRPNKWYIFKKKDLFKGIKN